MSRDKNKGGQLHGLMAIIALSFNTILCFIPILFIGILKLIPNLRWQALCAHWVDSIASAWTSINNVYIDRTQRIKWDITGLDNLYRKNWYLIIANHQSWLDIVILQRIFNRKIPTLKFFIKDQLKWVPLLGFAWWAMGCPFMKRYSKDYLAKNPHKKGKDLQATQKAIRLFQLTPVAVMNFIEGTRYSPQKSQNQKSPYQHLLKPKAGGLSFIISSMGNQFILLDVTIIYSNKQHSLWDFLCKRIEKIRVHIRQLPIPDQFTNAALVEDMQLQTEFRDWLNHHWVEKDRLIASMKP